jgi:predicted permease
MPCLIGFLLFVSRIPMPEPILELSSYLASLCTPISILISGANLARRSLKKIFTNKNVYYVNLIKLIIMPVCVTLLLWLIGVPSDMIVFGAVMAAMPCAAIVTMFGEIYRVSPGYASELVGSSTLFCIITIFPTVTFAQLLASYPIW